jgi:hypothetical protein
LHDARDAEDKRLLEAGEIELLLAGWYETILGRCVARMRGAASPVSRSTFTLTSAVYSTSVLLSSVPKNCPQGTVVGNEPRAAGWMALVQAV